MDKKALLDSFKQHGKHRKQLTLSSGLPVMGTHVDEHNMLWYYIDNNGEILLEPAREHVVIEVFPENKTEVVTVTNKPQL